MAKLFANSGDPDQTSELSLHCLPITLLGVSRLQWVQTDFTFMETKCHYISKSGFFTCLNYLYLNRQDMNSVYIIFLISAQNIDSGF